jgi:hypothetical protein
MKVLASIASTIAATSSAVPARTIGFFSVRRRPPFLRNPRPKIRVDDPLRIHIDANRGKLDRKRLADRLNGGIDGMSAGTPAFTVRDAAPEKSTIDPVGVTLAALMAANWPQNLLAMDACASAIDFERN